MAADKDRAARAIEEFLAALGLDPRAGELAGTGARVADAFADELCEGYAVDARALLRAEAISIPAKGPRQIVTLRDLTVTMTCPHHLMTGTGTATVAFAPRDAVVGVGALVRVVHAYARRLTLQETVGVEIVRAIDEVLRPSWVACRLVMTHGCMTARGERAHGARLDTLSTLGDDEAAACAAVGIG